MNEDNIINYQREIIQTFQETSLAFSDAKNKLYLDLEKNLGDANNFINQILTEIDRQMKEQEKKKIELSRSPLLKSLYYRFISSSGLDKRYPYAIEEEEANFLIKEAEQEYDNMLNQAKELYQNELAEIQLNHDDFLRELKDTIDIVKSEYGIMITSWDDPLWHDWIPEKERLVPFVRIGDICDSEERNSLSMPILFPIINGNNIVIKMSGDTCIKDIGIQGIQSILLRLLTTVPPGRLRFVLIDPVKSGHSLATFLRLSDFDKDIISGRHVWVEPRHIDEQLSHLAEHMEYIIQTLLRDKYMTIEDYNNVAKEMAEPYIVLVALNLPVNFTDTAIRHLTSIAINGPRCGIYTIITIDEDRCKDYHWI